jgi:hypothetical protein
MINFHPNFQNQKICVGRHGVIVTIHLLGKNSGSHDKLMVSDVPKLGNKTPG